MNTLRNKVQLIGNLGQNPEIRTLENGKSVAKLSLATTESYRDAQGKKVTDTQWHNLSAWGNLAKIAEKYLVKGSEIAIEGRLMHRTYEDKDGVKRYFTEIVVSELVMLRKKESQEE